MNRAPDSQLGNSARWHMLVAEQDRARAADLYSELTAVVETSDIPFLLSTAETGSDREKTVAIGLVTQILNKRKELITADHGGALLRLLPSLLASYPQSLGLNTFYLLRNIAPERAEDFLLSIDIEKLEEQGLSTLLANLALFPSAKATEKMLQLSKMPGSIGEQATKHLELRGLITEHKLKSVAELWRETHSRSSLNQLYSAFVCHQMGQPTDKIFEVLGEPSEQRDGLYFYYHTSDGVTLFLESDDKGRLSSAKIK